MCPRSPNYAHFPSGNTLICPAIGQIQRPSPDSADLLDFFNQQHSWLDPAPWLWSTFARPVTGAQRSQAYYPSSQGEPAPIERLPNELLDQIIDFLSDDKRDVLSLGLSSAVVWPVVLHHVQRENEQSMGIWAGKQVFYHGQSVDAHLFDCIDSDRRQQWRVSDEFVNTIYQLAYTHKRFDSYPKTPLPIPPAQQWIDAADAASHWSGFSLSDLVNIRQDLLPAMFLDQTYVLRNLTKNEFIRSDRLIPSAQEETGSHKQHKESSNKPSAISKALNLLKARSWAVRKRPFDDLPEMPISDLPFDTSPLSFAQIFLLLTCRTLSAPLCERHFDFQMGRWSGHCFDIISLEAHETETNSFEWADVSELAVDEVANLRHWVRRLKGGRKFHQYRDCRCRPMEEDRLKYRNWEGFDGPRLAFY